VFIYDLGLRFITRPGCLATFRFDIIRSGQ